MRNAAIKFMGISLLFTVLYLTGGCTAVIHDVVASQAPAFIEILEKAPPLQDGYARIICYYPRVPLAGFSLTGIGGFATLNVVVDGDGGEFSATMIDQSGFFLDVPAGHYTIAESTGGAISADFQASKQYCVKFTSNPNLLHGGLPVIIEPQQALNEIKEKNIRSDRLKDAYETRYALMPKKETKWESVSSDLLFNEQNSSKVNLYVFNTKSSIVGPGVKIQAGVDCSPSYVVACKKYTCFEVSPGLHALSLKITNFGSDYGPPSCVGFYANSGKNIYYTCSLGGLTMITEEEGLKLLRKYKLTPNGHYSPMKSTF